MIDAKTLAKVLREFARARDWEQFHTPKNIATSISIEASELLELFQWSRGEKGWDELNEVELRERVEQELADVLIYIVRFADLANIDLQAAAERKLESNAEKYPVDQFRGSDRKYNEQTHD